MPGTLNLYLCMFLLCVTGAVSGPLRRARIHPAVAGIFCLFTMFFSVFEEVQLLPRLYVSPGGFFMPLERENAYGKIITGRGAVLGGDGHPRGACPARQAPAGQAARAGQADRRTQVSAAA